MFQQLLQVFDVFLGSTAITFILYSHIVLNVLHHISDIACARQWFLTMFLTRRFSKTNVSYCLAIVVDVLCRKSLRQSDTFSCNLATLNLCLFLFELHFCFLLKRLCCFFKRLSFFLRCLGLGMNTPSLRTPNSLIPTSIATIP